MKLSSPVFGMLRAYSHIAPTGRGGYRLVRLARRFLPQAQWKDRFRTPQGLSLHLDLGTYPDCCMAFGLYELDTIRAMRRLLQPGGWFVDCGANIGYFTLLAAHRVGAAGRVDAFEPDPLNRERLQQHLTDNRVSWVEVHPVGVGSEAKQVQLYHPNAMGSNHGMSSTIPPDSADIPNTTVFSIDIRRLDQELNGVPDLIKLDVEGAELAAIEGAAGLLQGARPPAWVIEHNPLTASRAGFPASAILRRLLSSHADYRFFAIDVRLRELSAPEDLDREKREMNILAIPRSRSW